MSLLPVMAAPTVRTEAVVQALRASRFRVSTEAALQASIGEALASAGFAFEREVRLAPGERIDFLVDGRIGIEAKARYAKRATFRQLERYAAIAQVEALILITGTAIGLPEEINGKPLFLVALGRAAL